MKKLKLLIILLFISGCFLSKLPVTARGSETISGEIQVLSNVSETEMKKYLEAFSKKYPDIKVTYECLADYESEIKTRLSNGTYGDVLFIPGFLPASQYSTHFSILGQYSVLSGKYNYLDISARAGDNIYGIPSYAYTTGILYNKDVFYYAGISEVPKTTNEFLSALSAIHERTDAIPFYTNYTSPWALQYWEHFPYIDMTGNPDYRYNLFVYEKNPYLEGSTHYQVYELLYEIVERGLCEENPLASDWEKSKQMLNNGEIASIVIGSWAVSQFKAAGTNEDSIAFMPFPHEINGMQYMTISTDYNYAINKNSKYPKAARAYVDFMLDESGYALDHETLSIVKTDPYPESYGSMENVVLLTTGQANNETYNIKQKLSKNLNMEDGSEAQRVIEAAKGYRKETFADIAKDWNSRWEASRPANMKITEREEVPALIDSVLSDSYSVSFSKTEQEFINNQASLTVGYSQNTAPFQYEKEGHFTGLSLDVCEIIQKTTGLSFTYVPFQNTEEMIVALQRGEIDMIAGLDSTMKYEQELKYSKEYSSQMNVIVQNKSIDVSALEHARFASVTGEKNSYSSTHDTELLQTHATFGDAIFAVNNDDADYTVTNYYTADYYIEELECENVSILPLSEPSKLCFAYAPNVDTRLISICNKCIYDIPDETIQMHLREHMKPAEKEITLERFIRSNPITCLMVVSCISILVVTAILLVYLEKSKSAKKQALDVKRYEILASMVDEYIVEYDHLTNTCYFDEKLQKKFGVAKKIQLSSLPAANTNIGIVLQHYNTALEEEKDCTELFRLTDASGTVNWYKLLFHTIYTKDHTPLTVIGKLCNMQKEVEEKEQIEDKAQRDALTGIYNRKGFDRRWTELCKTPEENLPVTIIVLDADDFKGVNDTLGHAGGDAVLQLIANSLTEIFKETSIICRYGGDEFMLCVYNQDADTVRTSLNKLVKSLDIDFVFQDKKRKISISVGAYHTSTLTEFEELFREADKSLYQTKEKGKNGYVLRTEHM